jgi:hypothetical protein
MFSHGDCWTYPEDVLKRSGVSLSFSSASTQRP